jgi:hypothetical protein
MAMATNATADHERRCSPWPFPSPGPLPEGARTRGRRSALRAPSLIEGPDGDIDRIVRSVRENGGTISNKLIKEIPALADEELAAEVAAAIQAAFLPPQAEGNP